MRAKSSTLNDRSAALTVREFTRKVPRLQPGRRNGLDYNKTRVRSPVTALLRYSLADAFVVIVVHSQRHLLQVRRVSQLSEFPLNNITYVQVR